MKKRFLNIEQAGVLFEFRNQKRTTGLIVGSIVAAVAGLGAAGINAASQSAANSANMQLNAETLEEQKKLFHEANQFNHDEAQIARDFNAEESEKARTFQAGQLDKQLEFFKPANQVARYLEAGLNPATLAGNTNSGGFGIPSGNAASSSPASSSGVPTLPVGHVNPVNYGDFAKVLGDAVNSGVNLSHGFEDTKQKVTFNEYYEEFQKAGLNVSRLQARVLWNQYNDISVNIEKTRKSIDDIVASIGLKENQGKYYDRFGDLITEQKLGQHLDNIFKDKSMQSLIRRAAADAGISELHAKYGIALLKSEVAKNFGAAAYSNALSELTSVEKEFKEKGIQDELNLLSENRKYLENSNNLLDVEYQVAKSTKGKRVEEEIKSLEWKNSNWMRFSEFLKNVTVPVATGVGLYLGARGAKGVGASTVKGPTIYTNSPKGSVPGLSW